MTDAPLVVIGLGHDGRGLSTAVWSLLQGQSLHVNTIMLQLPQTKPLGTLYRLELDSPMFILRARKI
jgi:hypothetical protein